MFTILRIETLETWDQILYVAVFGCDGYPGAYDYTAQNGNSTCRDPQAFGWIAAILLFAIAVFGAYVLPTVLIGIVSIKFDQASSNNQAAHLMQQQKDHVVSQAMEDLPTFFHRELGFPLIVVASSFRIGRRTSISFYSSALYDACRLSFAMVHSNFCLFNDYVIA